MENKKWEDCGREDLNSIPSMVHKGFAPDFSHTDKRMERTTPENCPHDAVSFIKGTLHIWRTYDFHNSGEMGWMTADLINGSYTNHKAIKSLTEVK